MIKSFIKIFYNKQYKTIDNVYLVLYSMFWKFKIFDNAYYW